MDDEPKWKARALAIEFWLATAIVDGSFLVGIYNGLKYLLN